MLPAEGRLPQVVREDRDLRGNQRRLSRRRRWSRNIGLALAEQAALCGWHTEGAQQIVIHLRRSHAQEAIASRQVDLAGCVRANGRKRRVDLAELQVLRWRHPELFEPEGREPGRQVHQLPGLRVSGAEEFFRAVRTINASLPREQQLRVLLGDPPFDWDRGPTREDWLRISRDRFAADLIQREVLSKPRRALVIYGEGHFLRQPPPGGSNIVTRPGASSQSRIFTIWTHTRGGDLRTLHRTSPRGAYRPSR